MSFDHTPSLYRDAQHLIYLIGSFQTYTAWSMTVGIKKDDVQNPPLPNNSAHSVFVLGIGHPGQNILTLILPPPQAVAS